MDEQTLLPQAEYGRLAFDAFVLVRLIPLILRPRFLTLKTTPFTEVLECMTY